MESIRKYGKPPFDVALIHGGPGAAGEMAPVAHKLARDRGVLEPFQTAASLAGQVEELKAVLEAHAGTPTTLVGFSWGAWLGVMIASEYPSLVKKLLLVGSGPFEADYAARIEEVRLSRLTEEERREIRGLLEVIDGRAAGEKAAAFERFGAIFSKADTYDALPEADDPVEFRADIFKTVWPEGAQLRRSGRLLEHAAAIRCPVVAIHGDYDPHPAEGVRKPLSGAIRDFRLVLLERCGHKPWIERHARDEFYRILNREI